MAAIASVNVYQLAAPKPVDAQTLAKAQALLEQLPLDEIPPIAALPQGSRPVYSPNPLFVGRQEDLRNLAKALKAGGAAAIGQTAATAGLGGVGKTQLAVEFAQRYGRYFAGGVYWLSFADPAGVEAEIVQCGLAGGLDLPPNYAQLDFADPGSSGAFGLEQPAAAPAGVRQLRRPAAPGGLASAQRRLPDAWSPPATRVGSRPWGCSFWRWSAAEI